jgi:hypothetical protein
VLARCGTRWYRLVSITGYVHVTLVPHQTGPNWVLEHGAVRQARTLVTHTHDAGWSPWQPHGQVLRYYNRRPITFRRYDGLWKRLGEHLPWVVTQRISAHWLRHTIITWVERRFGYVIPEPCRAQRVR